VKSEFRLDRQQDRLNVESSILSRNMDSFRRKVTNLGLPGKQTNRLVNPNYATCSTGDEDAGLMKRIPCMTRRSSRPGRLLAEVTARGCLHLQKDGRGGEGSKGECCNAPVIIQARTEWHDSGSRSPFAVYDNDKWFLRRFIISHSPRVCVASLMAERVSDIPPTRH